MDWDEPGAPLQLQHKRALQHDDTSSLTSNTQKMSEWGCVINGL